MGFLDDLEDSLAMEQNTAVQGKPVSTIETNKVVQEAGTLSINAEATKRKRTAGTNLTVPSKIARCVSEEASSDEHLITRRNRNIQNTEARESNNQERGTTTHADTTTPTAGPIVVQDMITAASASHVHSTASGYMQQLLKYCPPLESVRQYTPSIGNMAKSMHEIASLPIQEMESAYDQLSAFMSGYMYILKEKQISQRVGLQKAIDQRTEEIEFISKQLQELQNPVGKKGEEAFHDSVPPEEEDTLRVAESERDSFKARVEELEEMFKESEKVRRRLELEWSANDSEVKKLRMEVDKLNTKLFFQADTAKKELNRSEILVEDLRSANQEHLTKIQDLLQANDELSSKVEAVDGECKRISALMEKQKIDSKRLNNEGFSNFMASQKVTQMMESFYLRVHRHGQRVGAAKATDLVKVRFPKLDVPFIDFADDGNFRGRAGVEEFVEDIPNLSGEFRSFLDSVTLKPTDPTGKTSLVPNETAVGSEGHAAGKCK